MTASVPCDGAWHRIYASAGVWAHVFVKYNGTTCKFTARLIDDPIPPAPAPVVKRDMVIPVAGGWRGLNANFEHFEVKCDPVAGGANPSNQTPQQVPDVQASRRSKKRAPAPLHDCPFEWYMIV
jgi:hypothetical protein